MLQIFDWMKHTGNSKPSYTVFSAFLVLRLFNTVSSGCSDPNHKRFSLLLHNCKFTTVINCKYLIFRRRPLWKGHWTTRLRNTDFRVDFHFGVLFWRGSLPFALKWPGGLKDRGSWNQVWGLEFHPWHPYGGGRELTFNVCSFWLPHVHHGTCMYICTGRQVDGWMRFLFKKSFEFLKMRYIKPGGRSWLYRTKF